MFFLKNGTVKSFDDAKGYGWIVPADGTNDLFVHQLDILGADVKTLPIDAKVTYEFRTNHQALASRTSDKSLVAINVTLSR